MDNTPAANASVGIPSVADAPNCQAVRRSLTTVQKAEGLSEYLATRSGPTPLGRIAIPTKKRKTP